MQIAPSLALAPVVRHYLILEHQSVDQPTHRYFPDGSPGLVFSYADPLTESTPSGLDLTQHQLFFYGQTDQYYDLKPGKRVGLLIVVFQPWGLYAISGLPGKQTINLRLSMDHLFGPSINSLQQQLTEQSTLTSRIQLIEAFLLQRQLMVDTNLDRARRAAIAISQAGGILPIQQLSEWLATTERSLERHFNYVIGMSPKHYSRIIRLQRCLKFHRQQPLAPSAQLAYEAGYYDQAHFIGDLLQVAGLTPKQYTANTRRLAANLVPLVC